MGDRKYTIELNGISNLQLLMSLEIDKEESLLGESRYCMNEDTYLSILKEIRCLTEYMQTYVEHLNKGEEPPQWFEIKAKLNVE